LVHNVSSWTQALNRRDDMNDSHDHTPASLAAPRVLAERKNAGIRVTLLWAEDTNAVSVLVREDGTGDQFELSVEPGANALDTFEHPYAYAAWRGVTSHSDTYECEG
jgi:hypothetical protein